MSVQLSVRKSLLVGCALLSAFLAKGCVGEPTPEATETAIGETPSVGLDAAPLRIVGLAPSINELVIAMGGGDRLAARTDYDTHPESVELPSIGGGLDPSLEVLVGLDIDLVLMVEARETPALADRLEELGIRVALFPTNTISDIYESIGRLGLELDLEPAADSLATAIREGLGEVTKRVADRDPVRVMYVVWSDPPMTTGGGTFVDEVIRLSGGRNVFDDAPLDWPTVGFESIVDRNPDVVLWPRGDISVGDVERLSATPGWREVPAVREGRVVVIDGNLYGRPGPNIVEAARRLAEILHPEVR